MCNRKNDSLWCYKHAHKRFNRTYREYRAVSKEAEKKCAQPMMFAARKLKTETDYSRTVERSSPEGLVRFNSLNPDYKKYERFQKLVISLKRNKVDAEKGTPLQVGNRVNIGAGWGLTKAPRSLVVVVRVTNESVTVWSYYHPERTITIHSDGKVATHSMPLRSNEKPDLQWVIWNHNINPHFSKA